MLYLTVGEEKIIKCLYELKFEEKPEGKFAKDIEEVNRYLNWDMEVKELDKKTGIESSDRKKFMHSLKEKGIVDYVVVGDAPVKNIEGTLFTLVGFEIAWITPKGCEVYEKIMENEKKEENG